MYTLLHYSNCKIDKLRIPHLKTLKQAFLFIQYYDT